MKRGLGAANESDIDINTPPYAIHNGFGRLSIHALATNATHAAGFAELDVHNLWGLMEERATHSAVQEIIPGKRPVLISRSTFASAGKWTGHWVSWIAMNEIRASIDNTEQAGRQFQQMAVLVLQYPRYSPVPDIPDSDGRRRHLRVQ